MSQAIQRFQQALAERRAVKVITGIANFDVDHVLRITQSVVNAGQSDIALDVAADVAIVKAVRDVFDGVLFASSIEPQALAAAIAAGADVAELGNFDALYDQGYYIDAAEVLRLARETRALLPEGAWLCVTVPGHLDIDAQVALNEQLAAQAGVNLIQTEGALRTLSADKAVQTLGPADKAALSVRNTRALAAASPVAVMAASGMSAATVAGAILAGAAAVGIGAAINRLETDAERRAELSAIVTALAGARPALQAAG